MIDDLAGARPEPDRSIAEDWITIWESECRALSGDRETGEAIAAATAFWAAMAREVAAWTEPWPPSADARPGGVSRARAATRPASAAVAPDAGGAALAELAGRVAELERRLDAATSGGTGG